MIKLIEAFDNIGTGTETTLIATYGMGFQVPYTFGADASLLTQRGWIFTGNCPFAKAGVGRMGTAALGISTTHSLTLPSINRKCSRIVIGAAVIGPLGHPGGYGNPPTATGLDFYFQYLAPGAEAHTNFRIRCLFNRNESITVSMWTGSDGSGYPAITITEPAIPTPYSHADYTFIELYVDVADYMSGRVKVAVNGKTYVDKTGIITAAYNAFGNNPYDDRAKLNRVYIATVPAVGYYGWIGDSSYYYDTIYLCDDAGGYQDDFLGPIFSKSFYPVAAGSKSNWSPYVNSAYHEDGKHHERVDDDPVQPGNELEYLEADQDLTEEMFVFPPDPIPVGSAVVSVNHRTMFRNVASPGTPPPNALIPLYQIAGNPAVVTNSLAKKISGWLYENLDVYYNTVPGLAIPWTEYLLEQSEFGFLLREPTWTGVSPDVFGFADDVMGEHVPEVTEVSFDFADDVSDSATDIAIWDVTIEDELGVEDDPADAYFPVAEEELGLTDDLFGTVEGLCNVCTAGTATASSNNSVGQSPDKAFNDNLSDQWHSSSLPAPGPHWLAYQLEDTFHAVIPVGYWIYWVSYHFPPTAWQFQVGKGNGEWVTIDTKTGQTFATGWQWFPLPEWDEEAVDKFRLLLTGYESYVAIYEMRVMTLVVEAIEE